MAFDTDLMARIRRAKLLEEVLGRVKARTVRREGAFEWKVEDFEAIAADLILVMDEVPGRYKEVK